MTQEPAQSDLLRVRDIAIVFVVALAARLLFLALVGPQLTGDSQAYVRIAQNLVDHGVFSLSEAVPYIPTTRRPPGYPWLLAAVYELGTQSPWVVAAIQCVLDAATAALITLLARDVVPRPWALGVALVYALHPGPIPYTSYLLSETLFTFTLVGSAAAFVDALRRS